MLEPKLRTLLALSYPLMRMLPVDKAIQTALALVVQL